ncbi:MAG: orotidine-5'-phosphate decarboxylase [Actinobacteria bacterium]|nr:orotidine-5'-phosphate decarboxylase [Actinomycetota bacterium]MSW77083.1 orotidine-5'-phosphate decarboxylase [Actinomycetota bacterium]MSX55997.1 orotidine-5'-phosphate decarboxylase [Actinomycetota bacterium]MSZ83049.1 orotidine-5'-phosphate decarboxylase [Actinomycetota bacterium]MTB17517.1 orotidine-5'-phosphate decarboxylase [Actinomycetota bacterium]
MAFHEQLRRAWQVTDSMLCVGLDPDPARFPQVVDGSVFEFCRAIVDATADVVCAFKPQIAYFAATGAEADLERLCVYIRDCHPETLLVLDAKRGDIGSTAEQYAREAFDRYGAHAVTVNPYLGGDSVEPFLRHPDGGVFVLCRTSNPGSGDFQSLPVDGRPLYLHVAERVAREWNTIGDCGLVVGATYPAELAEVRALVGDLPLLVPGVGAQGGDIAATVQAGSDSAGHGMVVNSSRAILYASSGADFADAARAEAIATRDALRAG